MELLQVQWHLNSYFTLTLAAEVSIEADPVDLFLTVTPSNFLEPTNARSCSGSP